MKFKKDALSDPNSFFHTFAHLPDKEAIKIAQTTWREINCKNLIENILPTRERADLILHKADNHDVD